MILFEILLFLKFSKSQKIDQKTGLPVEYCRIENDPCHKFCRRFNSDDAKLQEKFGKCFGFFSFFLFDFW